jgi:hypothetical protein
VAAEIACLRLRLCAQDPQVAEDQDQDRDLLAVDQGQDQVKDQVVDRDRDQDQAVARDQDRDPPAADQFQAADPDQAARRLIPDVPARATFLPTPSAPLPIPAVREAQPIRCKPTPAPWSAL